MIKDLISKISDPQISDFIKANWNQLETDFNTFQNHMPNELRMTRSEISFHQDTILLGYLALLTAHLPGDILEIGVWKGKSLAFMNRLKQNNRIVIGIDPLELLNQESELNFYKNNIYPDVQIINLYSELALNNFLKISNKLSILHIDGGHETRHVLVDFLLYEKYITSGGFVLFDDYRDFIHSPDVGPAVDLLRVGGLFKNYNIFGNIPGFSNSYLLQKR